MTEHWYAHICPGYRLHKDSFKSTTDLRIVTWNCNGAFRKKFEHISNFNAELYIIQECENPATTQSKAYQEWAGNYLWIGDTKNKGLAVFAKSEIGLQQLDWSDIYTDHKVRHFLPCRVNQEFDLLAVWTHKNNSPNFGYIGQFWKYLQINKGKLGSSLIAGDFNSNTIWDEWDRWWNHSDVVQELEAIEITSFYHLFSGEKQGQESIPTMYHQRNKEKPYHIDYLFGARKFSERLKAIEIGKATPWLQYSDHMPVYCELA